MDLFGGYKWVWWFHILVVSALLMVVPIMHLINGKVNPKILNAWFYILIAVGVGMIVYHGLKLFKSIKTSIKVPVK
jgi:hypothetical protein